MHVRSGPPPAALRSRRLPPALLLLVLLLIGLVSLPGCSGCWGGSQSAQAKKKKEDEEKEKEKEKKKKKKLEKPKDDFEPLMVRLLPSNDPTPAIKAPPIWVKPGHWISVAAAVKANNFDFPGELATFVEQQGTQQPLELEDGTTRMGSWCPAILPKGQAKRIESLFFVPKRKDERLGNVYSLRNELRGARGGRLEAFSTNISTSLKDYEHLIVVLAANSTSPAAYTHFDKLLSVKMPAIGDTFELDAEPVQYYHVVRPTCERSAPVPSHSLAWTTIAYVFWDDLNPAVLTTNQQQALLDWLHWGGQLVISGPSSLDKLKGSFLEPYLPALAKETVKLDEAAFESMNRRFSLGRDTRLAGAEGLAPKDELAKITISEERPMLGIELEKHAEAHEISGTGGLVVERRLGGGRIVVTRFPLTDVRIKQWRNFDGFFNAVLLRRPPRIFSQNQYGGQFGMEWDAAQMRDMLLETRLNTTLRYFSRDVGGLGDQPWSYDVAQTPPPEEPADPNLPPGKRGKRPTARGGMSGAPVFGAPGGFGMMPGMIDSPRVLTDTSGRHPDLDDWRFAGYEARRPTGIAAWNDQGAASTAAHQALTEGAGIQIPRADFVMKVLGVYLLVLVPLNWLVFWTIGRVEWAWIAAPIIAIGGAAAVIRLAQLDIGFARSRTEVAILEVQGGYERAHLTRYSALYTSLSSSYTLGFEEPSALAMPFTAGPRNEQLLINAQYNDVAFRRDKETALTGVQVSSNSTGMVHSEQMFPLGENPKVTESLLLVGEAATGYSVRNTTDLVLRDVGVFRRVDVPGQDGEPAEYSPRIETAYVRQLDAATSAPLRFEPMQFEPPKLPGDSTSQARQPATSTLQSLLRHEYPRVWLPEWESVPILRSGIKTRSELDTTEQSNAAARTDTPRVRLTQLARLAVDRLRLMPGEVRLVGWTDQRLPGMRIRPEAPQNSTYTLVVAHLVRGELPRVRADRNRAEDFLDPTYFDETPAPDVPLELSEPAAP